MVTIAAATKEQKQHDDNNQNSHVLTYSFPLWREQRPLSGFTGRARMTCRS